MYKNSFFKIVIISFVLLMISSIFVYVVDPFLHYHSPWLGLEAALYNEVYQNPGVIKNLEYDSIITGSSMTQNFKVSQVDELFNTKSVKVTYSGAKSKDIDTVLSRAMSEKNLEIVILGLDIPMLVSTPIETRHPHPKYIYNDILLDDVRYLLNKDVIFSNSKRTLEQQENDINRDSSYSWHTDQIEYSRDAVLSNFTRAEKAEKIELTEELNDIIHANILNISKHIERDSETRFIVFYPPYSILFWDTIERKGTMESTLSALKIAVSELSHYENVEQHFFHDMLDVTTNLDNYKDYTHYSPEINELILRLISEKTYLIDDNNVDERLDNLEQKLSSIDFDAFFK